MDFLGHSFIHAPQYLGLGLAVVARNVEQLKGQLRVESNVGEGSRFSCLIPLALPGTPDHGENEPDVPSLLPSLARPSKAVSDIRELFDAFSFSQGSTSNVLGTTTGNSDRFVAEPPGSRGAKSGNQETCHPPQSSAAELQSPAQLRVLVVDVSLISVLTASYILRVETG